MLSPPLTPGTLVDAVAYAIRQRIDARQLAPGARIPSVRAFAQTMGVSKSTVVEAYERLAAEGLVASRPGSGFYVVGPTRPFVLKAVEPQLDLAVDAMWITRQSLQAGPELLTPGSGFLPNDWMPEASIRRHLRHLAKAPDTNMTRYDQPLGHAPLRAQIARRLDEKHISATPDQIVLVGSATHALELLCRFLLQPGDTVVIDDPCYFNFIALLRAHRVRIVGVPFTPDGPDIAAFAAILSEHRPRLYVTNAALHNPTGATLTPATVHRVLKLCEAHDVLIVEDDIWGDVELAPSPRLAGFDGLNRVIHIGSFSKTLSAALRCGWIAVRADWVEPLVDLKLALTLGGGPFAAALAHRFIIDGASRHHLSDLRQKLADAMARTATHLERCGLEIWTRPSAGFFLWARLPDGCDAADVARSALRRNMILAPGAAFSLSSRWNEFMRFNVAHCADPRIMAILREAIAEARQLPAAPTPRRGSSHAGRASGDRRDRDRAQIFDG